MSLLTTMIRHLGTDSAKSANRTSPDVLSLPASCHVVFVATDLEIKEFAWVRTNETDIEREGKDFRRLSPEYFAWLRSRTVTARAAHKAGKLHNETWNTLRQRFNALQELAIREGKPPGSPAVIFSEELPTTCASSRVPGETRRSSQK